ncbi:acyl-CoA thioesterase [Ottowia sp.]|uniref:acyl-CoA thioesterase n=1 Tax=Ottowia sp. TaxID=1898956 RepID=UPI003A8ADE34
MTHPFDQALTLDLQALPPDADQAQAARVFAGRTHPDYANMVGPFGGVTAAQMLQAVLRHPDRLGDPLALTVNYAAGLRDAPFRIEARPARTNRSTQHWTLSLVQVDEGGQESTYVTATAVTAARRSTWSAVEAPMPSDVPAPESTERVAAPGRVRWTDRYDMRAIAGRLPMQWDGTEADSVTRLWVRDDPLRPLDFASLAAMSDVFFPRVWRRRAHMTPAGTVSITVYFHVSADGLAATGTGWLLGQARAQSFFNGFFDQSAELWNEAGHLLATTHQIVYYKE